MRFFIPLLLVIVSVALFVVYIDPSYQAIKSVQAETLQYDNALSKSKELQALRQKLSSERNSFSADDLNRLQLMLPDTIDNIRLVLDVDTIASHYGMVIKDLKISSAGASAGAVSAPGAFNPTADDVKSVDLTFSVSADYPTFLKFLRDLENSLRLIDVKEIAFNAPDTKSETPTISTYTLTVRTYWLP